MSGRLADFLIRLSIDQKTAKQFEDDAVGTMNAAGLSADEKRAVLSRNPEMIRIQLGQPHVSHMTHVDPGPEHGNKNKDKDKGKGKDKDKNKDKDNKGNKGPGKGGGTKR